MEKIKVLISWSGDNYFAGTDQVNGTVFATHKDINKVKAEFETAFAFHIKSSLADGDKLSADLQNGRYQFEYELLISAILHKYENFITLSAIHKVTGINERQLGHYKTGKKKPRPQQRDKIVEGLHTIGKELLEVV
ncbi:MAG: hypothetical protein WCJ72_18510 [Chryseobacterium sp.]